MSDPMQNRQVIFEFFPVGAYVRVTAMDTQTLTEVSIQGPANAPEAMLKQNALKRLEYVMRKKGVV
jgi:hypothetical protein